MNFKEVLLAQISFHTGSNVCLILIINSNNNNPLTIKDFPGLFFTQVKNIIYHAVKDAVGTLKAHESKLARS